MLDDETRGLIENQLDYAIKTLDVNYVIGWVLNEFPIESVKDFALGFALGSLSRYAQDVALKDKGDKKIIKDLEKEYGKEAVETLKEREEEEMKEMGEPFRVILTEREKTQIRDILKRRILDIRDMVIRSLNM